MAEHFLVTGGAGYVGSHMVDLLVEQGAAVTVVDDLRQGHRAALPPGVELITANVADFDAINQVIAGRDWHAIIHFAALSLVGDSMQRPMHYLRENASGGFTLIDAAIATASPASSSPPPPTCSANPTRSRSLRTPPCARVPRTARAN